MNSALLTNTSIIASFSNNHSYAMFTALQLLSVLIMFIVVYATNTGISSGMGPWLGAAQQITAIIVV